jgi:epsilon-lactone hydrolase
MLNQSKWRDVEVVGAADFWSEGDIGNFRPLFSNAALEGQHAHPYFKCTRTKDSLAFPLRSEQVMGKFPSSLLVTATRDHALSSVVQTHSCLVRQGVKADLHVWEGLGHAFFLNPGLSASREVRDVAVNFFASNLGNC